MDALVYDARPVRWAMCKLAGWVTPRAYVSRLSGLRLARVAVPKLPNGRWVRLRSIMGGICGTDFAAITQTQHPASILQAFASLPAVLGHENVAVVDEVGEQVRGWQPGERVVVEPSLSCVPRGIEPICPMCAAGRFTLCDHFRDGGLPAGSMIGWNSFTGGSWATYFVAHESQLHRVPTELTDEQAVLTDPLASALHAVLRRVPADGENVLIVGAGLLGMGVAASIRALGCKCRLTTIVWSPRQAELMRRFGVDDTIASGPRDNQAKRYGAVAAKIGGRVVPTKFGHQAFIGGFDVVYDCVGTGASLTDAMKYVRSGGTVIEVGTSQIAMVDTAPLWFDELTVMGTNGRAIENYQGRRLHTYEIVFEMLRDRRIDTEGLVTHRFGIGQYRQALGALIDRGRSGAMKVVFVVGER